VAAFYCGARPDLLYLPVIFGLGVSP